MEVKKILNTIFVILVVTITSCSTPTEPVKNNIKNITEPPVVTGVYVTTNDYPDGTGEVIDSPLYHVKNINVFPNPFSAVYDDIPGSPEPFMIFNHMPEKATIIIIKGYTLQEINILSSFINMGGARALVQQVKTIQKNDKSKFAIWKCKDDKGNYVSSGYYRAYIYSDDVPGNYFLDISLKLTKSYLDRY